MNMNYKKFSKGLKESVDSIAKMLSGKKIKFSQTGSQFAIKKLKSNKLDTVKDDIDNIISKSFDCEKASKFRKFSFFDEVLYLQFKRRVS